MIYPYTFNGYEIRDLEKNDTSFIQEASAWNATILRSADIYSKCDGTYLLGGYSILGPALPSASSPIKGQYFERVYKDLPPHNAVYFTLTFWAIDSWDSNTGDSFQVQFDSKLISGWVFYYGSFLEKLCGVNNYKDLPSLRIFGSFTHSELTLDMRIINQLDQATDDESFGFREINLLFTNDSSSVSDGICGRAPITLSTNQCTCSEGSYQNPAGSSTCVTCDPACKSCFGQTAGQCYQCADGYYYNGTQCVLCVSSCATCYGSANNQCLICKSGKFLFNNNTCLSQCDLPLIKTTDGTTKFCERKCQTGQYLFDNTTCVSQCNLPLKKTSDGVTDFCDRPCPVGKFLYNNNTCLDDCNLPLIKTTDGITQFCERKCQTGQYLFDNTTCISPCDLPLKKTSDGFTDFCDRPCLAGKFLYQNTTCLDSCDLPLTQTSDGIVTFCESPCPSNKFIYDKDTCLPDCNSPLNQGTLLDFTLCINPCVSGDYLYWNKACGNTCNSPLVPQVNNTIKFCMDPCKESEYILSDGACLDSCDSPLVSKLDGDLKLCSFPCNNSNDYFYSDGTCQDYCNSPNKIQIVNSVKVCVISLSQEQVAQVKSISSTVDAGSTAMSTGVAIAGLLGSNNPATFTLAGFVKMLPYIRYMKIDFPPKLDYMLNNMNSSVISFSFGPNMPDYLEEKFTKHPLPGKFDEYGFHSSFIVNYWQTMTSLAIILGVIGVLSIIVALVKGKKYLLLIFSKLKLILKWNFFLMFFTTNLDAVALHTSFEFRSMVIDSFAEVLGLLVCLFVNGVTIFVLGKIIYIIRDIRKTKSQVAPHQKIVHDQDKWEEYQIFYSGSKDDSLIRHIFMFPFLMRLYLFNLIIAHLFEHPLVQSSIITTLGLTMLLYMVIKRPFKSKLVLCQHVSDELVLLTVNTSILILATLDHLGHEETYVRETLGDIIIMSNIVFSATANIYLLAYLSVGLWGAYKVIKKHKRAGLVAIIVAFMAPFESGGMDMEILPSEPNGAPATIETEPDIPISSEREHVKIRIQKRLDSVANINRHNSSIFSNSPRQNTNRAKSMVVKKIIPVSHSVASSPRNTIQALTLRGSATPQNNSTVMPSRFESAVQLSTLRFASQMDSPRDSPSLTERQLLSNQKLMGKISKFSNQAFRIDMPDQPRNMFENSVISEARDTAGDDSSRNININLETNRVYTPFDLDLKNKEDSETASPQNL